MLNIFSGITIEKASRERSVCHVIVLCRRIRKLESLPMPCYIPGLHCLKDNPSRSANWQWVEPETKKLIQHRQRYFIFQHGYLTLEFPVYSSVNYIGFDGLFWSRNGRRKFIQFACKGESIHFLKWYTTKTQPSFKISASLNFAVACSRVHKMHISIKITYKNVLGNIALQ